MSRHSAIPAPLAFVQYLRNILFYIHIILATTLIGLWGLPKVAFGGRDGATRVATVWIGHFVWSAGFYMGLYAEVRGTPPTHDCIVAAKHQSFWDIMVISNAVPRRAFIMKREVMRVPIMGWYAHKAGCIPIDRSRGRDAMKAISGRVSERIAAKNLGQLIIYPEGTRTHPGERRAYKHGVATIRAATGLEVVPVAVNTGLFWPRSGWGIRPGRAVVEFLPTIGPDLPDSRFMTHLEDQIEGNSERLMAEAGFRR